MLNWQTMLLMIFPVLFIMFTASAQSVEVLKAELKGVEGRLDAKIDGVKNELNATMEGTKNTLNASINGVKSEIVTIKWIIGGIGVAITIFLGFVGYLLNYFVKQLLPNMVQRESRSTGQIEASQPQREPTRGEGFTDRSQPDGQRIGGDPNAKYPQTA